MTSVFKEYLPPYNTHETEVDLHYGIDVLLSGTGDLSLQCDKYRDYHAVDVLPSGTINITQYAHDTSPAQLIGAIANDRFKLFRNDVNIIVQSKFRMTRAYGPLCIYSEFQYDGEDYLWKVKYKMHGSKETLQNCILLRDEKIVASFVPAPDKHTFSVGGQLLGLLFISCHPAQWPDFNAVTKDKILDVIKYHDKDRHADVMLVSFIALWKKILLESFVRQGISGAIYA